MKRRYLHTFLIVIAVLFIVAVFATERGLKDANRTQVEAYTNAISTDVWGLTFTDLDDDIVPLANFMGVPVVIQSWSTSCLFCTQEMPNLVSYSQEFSRTVKFVTVNRSEPKDTVISFLKTHDPNHQLYHLLDDGDLFYMFVGAVTEPETLFISAEGELIFQAQGPISDQEMRETITKMLE